MITHITVDRDCVSTRALHVKRLKHAANYCRRAVAALGQRDRSEWRKLMAYTCQCVDEAARYRMDHGDGMRITR